MALTSIASLQPVEILAVDNDKLEAHALCRCRECPNEACRGIDTRVDLTLHEDSNIQCVDCLEIFPVWVWRYEVEVNDSPDWADPD